MNGHTPEDSCIAFLAGFNYFNDSLSKTEQKKKHISAREAEKIKPQYLTQEIDAFINGYEDCASGDYYRFYLCSRGA